MKVLRQGKSRPVHTCSIRGCGLRAKSRGWCVKHYTRWKKYGDPLKITMGPECPLVCRKCGSKGPFWKGHRVCTKCGNKRHNKWRKDNPERARAHSNKAAKASYQRHRKQALAHYGGRCACCGEVEEIFLCIDHKNGGGNAHRRLLGKGKMCGSLNFYGWLVRSGFPKGFQVLCHNCNSAKSRGGCPHERNRNNGMV